MRGVVTNAEVAQLALENAKKRVGGYPVSIRAEAASRLRKSLKGEGSSAAGVTSEISQLLKLLRADNSCGRLLGLECIPLRSGRQSQAEKSAKVNDGAAFPIARVELIDMLTAGDLQHDGALEADCSRKKLQDPFLLRAISALSINLAITAPAFRCVFGRGERRERHKIWRCFLREIDASAKRAHGKDCDWAPSRMQRADRDATGQIIAHPELLAAVAVDYDGAGALGIAAALEERLPEMSAMDHAMNLLFGCKAHGKRALQELAGARNCDNSEARREGISLVSGFGGEQEAQDFITLLRAEGYATWATWVESRLIRNALFPQFEACQDPSRLLASDTTNSSESSHQGDCSASKHQGAAQGIMNLRAADQRKLDEPRSRMQARGAGRDAPGRARHMRAGAGEQRFGEAQQDRARKKEPCARSRDARMPAS